MKHLKLSLAVLGALGLASVQAQATGLVTVPATGFSGSAYTNCFNAGRTAADPKGNFGSYAPITNPTTSVNNTCATFPANDLTSPVAGYSLVVSTTRPVVVSGVTIGNVVDRVWRDTATSSQCIFGARFTATNALVGGKYFEVNDIARGGFGTGSVNAGYFLQAATASPIFRVGRTFTSVQHRAATITSGTNGTGYLDLPGFGSTANINGLNSWPLAVPTAAQQAADVNSNWVDFTLDAVYADDDGSTNNVSGMTYVQAACNSTAPSGWVKTGAIRLRQTAQENTTFNEAVVDGYAPPGAVVP